MTYKGKAISTVVLDINSRRFELRVHRFVRCAAEFVVSLHERAQVVGGKLSVWSELGSGTETELIIPASVAYAKSSAPHRPLFLEEEQRKLLNVHTSQARLETRDEQESQNRESRLRMLKTE